VAQAYLFGAMATATSKSMEVEGAPEDTS